MAFKQKLQSFSQPIYPTYNPRVVLYPLGALDTTPHILFPNADVFITINRDGFFWQPDKKLSSLQIVEQDVLGRVINEEIEECPKKLRELNIKARDHKINMDSFMKLTMSLPQGPGHLSPMAVSSRTRKQGGALPNLLMQLLAYNPNLIIHQATVFSDPVHNKSHGSITFQTGPNSKTKRWIYIQGQIRDFPLTTDSMIALRKDNLLYLPFSYLKDIDALVIRGSMATLDIPLRFSSPNFISRSFELINHIYSKNGIIVAGRNALGGSWEMLPDDYKTTNSELSPRQQWIDMSFKYSYGMGIRADGF